MAQFSDTLRDQYNRPVPGALVYIYTQTGSLAELRTSSGTALANPLKTDASGIYGFDADDAKYRREIRLGARSLDTSDIIVGDPPEFTGPPGPADNTYTTMSALLASDPARKSARLVPAAGETAPAGNFNYIDGAWVRQGAEGIATKRDSFARARTQQQRNDEVVSVLEYCVGDGVTDDTAAYQALIFRAPKEIYYPKGCRIKVTARVLLLGNTTHRFGNDAAIISNVDGYGVLGLGYPELSPATVTAPIAQDAVSFTFSGAIGLAPGEDFYLYDTATEEYDVNVVREIVGNTVYTKRPVIYPFANAGDIRIYSLEGACRNVQIIGGRFENINPSLGAHGLGFLNAVDIRVSGTTVTNTGGIGLGMEVSMRLLMEGVSALETGAVGLGLRNAKDWTITDFVGRNPGHDESLTLYKNCSFGIINGVDIEQYTTGNAPVGNPGAAGNCLLVDYNCSDVMISNIRLRGSATYALFITNGSRRVTVDNYTISNANLGGIRCALSSNDNRIGRGRITDIINAIDTEKGGVPTAAIQDDANCSGNVLGSDVTFARIAGNVGIRQDGARGTAIYSGNSDHRGGYVSASTGDWNGTSAGSRVMMRTVANTGNTYGRIVTETVGGTDFGATALSARATAPGLQFDGDVIFAVSPTAITLTWRDFAGATHSATLPAA